MATKLAKIGPMGGMHTSGIFSDMTVDGPEIGTLVVIVDRAKNLPNRKTMGKQDPYCAARLGKEARKTETDRRGGQTPRWDQELRFTVHDSPDYYNFKVSVFNDDKKTELIGETWIKLQDIITPGGGKSDTWHTLNCKGKYAGEIRLELTYYDTRPKEEKVVERKPVRGAVPDVQTASKMAGPREITPVKRRPLPSNPSGASPSSAPRSYHTPPRQQPVPQSIPQPIPRAQPAPQAQPSPAHRHTYYGGQRTADDSRAAPEMGHPVHRQVDPQRASYYEPQPPQPVEPTPEPAQNYYDLPARQEPEYPTTYTHDRRDSHGIPPMNATPPVPQHVSNNRHSPQPPIEQPKYIAYSPAAHGDRPYGHEISHSYSEPVMPHHYANSGDLQQPSRNSMYRASTSDQYSGTSLQQVVHYRAPSGQFPDYSEAPNVGHSPVYSQGYQESPMHSPNNAYSASPRAAMQPTVEDEDDVPPPPPVHRSSAPPPAPYEAQQPHYQPDLAPAPLRIAPGRDDMPPFQQDNTYALPPPLGGHSRPVSRDDMRRPSFSQERGFTHPQLTGSHSRPVSRDSTRHQPMGNELVPAYDAIAQHRRLSQSEFDMPNYGTPPRPHPVTQHESVSPQPSPHYQQSPESTALVRHRPVSPGFADPRAGRMQNRSTPTRKSVSPRPPPSASESERRLSSVPFSPDSFDELNPRVAATKSSSNSPGGSSPEKIVGFDGRVIDPSDHLPVDCWAPEPEPKGKDKDRPARPTRERLVMGAREIHRRNQSDRDIRAAVMGSSSTAALQGPTVDTSPLVPGSGSSGRNRLQKKQRNSPTDSMSMANGLSREYENLPAVPRVSPTAERQQQPQHYAYSPSPYSAGTRQDRRALPPPIPAKIPLNAPEVRGDELARLSAEMSTIDIGMGGGRRTGGVRAMGAGRVRDGMGMGRYG